MPDRERRRRLGRQMRLRSYHQEVTGHVEKMAREFISELSKSNNKFPMDVLAGIHICTQPCVMVYLKLINGIIRHPIIIYNFTYHFAP